MRGWKRVCWNSGSSSSRRLRNSPSIPRPDKSCCTIRPIGFLVAPTPMSVFLRSPTGNASVMVIPVIQYHKIDRPAPDSLVRGCFTPPPRFARQMAWLQKEGFVFYTASELIAHFQQHGAFPEKGITLTFDDGWQDNYTNAFPVL